MNLINISLMIETTTIVVIIPAHKRLAVVGNMKFNVFDNLFSLFRVVRLCILKTRAKQIGQKLESYLIKLQ